MSKCKDCPPIDVIFLPEPDTVQYDVVFDQPLAGDIILMNSRYLIGHLSPPLNLRASAPEFGKILLEWDPVNFEFDSYRLHIWNVTDNEFYGTVTDIRDPFILIDYLSYGYTYEFWVTTVIRDLQSDESNHVMATITLPPPQNPHLVVREDASYGSVDTYSIGNVVATYNWYLNNQLKGQNSVPYFTFQDLEPGEYTMTVTVTLHTSGLTSPPSDPVTVIVP